MPEITPEDRQFLEAASKLAGANYGTRLYSACALAALAIQRAAFERRVAELETKKSWFFMSDRTAIATVFGGLLICIAGLASYVWVNRPASTTALNNTNVERRSPPKIAHTPPLVAPSVDAAKVAADHPKRVSVTEKTVAQVQRPPERRTNAHATVHAQTSVRSSPWIADPLQGEALRLALIEDRKRTRQLNDEQLQQR